MGRSYTIAGLVFDLIGVVLLGVAAGIRHGAVKSGMNALKASGEPRRWQARTLRLSEKPGWILVILGFILQLVGAVLG